MGHDLPSVGVVRYILSMLICLPIRMGLSVVTIPSQLYYRLRYGNGSVCSQIDVSDDDVPVVYVGGFASYSHEDALSTILPNQLKGVFIPSIGPFSAVRHRVPLLIQQLKRKYPGWGEDDNRTRINLIGTSFGATTILGMLGTHPHLGAHINRIAFVSPCMGGFRSRYHATPPQLNSVWMQCLVTSLYFIHHYTPISRFFWIGMDHGTLSEYRAGHHMLTEDSVPENCRSIVDAGLDVAKKYGIPVCTWATHMTVRVGQWHLPYTSASIWSWLFMGLVGVAPVVGDDDRHHDGTVTLGSQLYGADHTGAYIVHPPTDHVTSMGLLPYLFGRSERLYHDVLSFLRGHCMACDGTLAHDDTKEHTSMDCYCGKDCDSASQPPHAGRADHDVH